ncbi:MAG: hypothetical protein KAS36_10635 [Anaerolineales bacterium]|nr:hypothetical protein [Anaerolineales bacterium]
MKTRFLFTGTLVSLLLLIVTVSALAAPASSAVYRFSDASEVPGASASLVRADGNVAMTLRTSELDQNAAYTIWWVVFNNPGDCSSPCGEDDIFDGNGDLMNVDDGTFGTPGVNVSVVFATGHVVGKNGVGNFGAGLREGKTSGALFGPGLVDAQGAEIHLIVRTHGELIPGMVNEQISTFGGGCGVNDCVDPQFAVFVPSP